jgi:MFS family permease
VQGYSPFGSGLRFLPWTLAPMFIGPLAGALSDKIPAKNLIGVGLAMQASALAWMASVTTPTTPYSELIGPFIVAGVGMALFFAPVANLVLSAVRPEEEGKSSGANNAIRELGGVFGVAVLASIFAHVGGYGTGQSFVDGMHPALFIGAGAVALGALAAFMIPRRPRVAEALEAEPELAALPALAYEAEAA